KKYYEFYEGTAPQNPRNHESCSSQLEKHLQPSLNKWHQAVLKAESRHENVTNLYDKERQAEQLYMDTMKKLFTHHSWEICNGWVLFQDPPQERFGPTPMFGSNTVGNEQVSPIIEETMLENPSPGQSSIPRTMGRNKA
ncbi:hypothetical protein C1H46_010770, partial [Malus baccata]